MYNFISTFDELNKLYEEADSAKLTEAAEDEVAEDEVPVEEIPAEDPVAEEEPVIVDLEIVETELANIGDLNKNVYFSQINNQNNYC